MDDSYYEANTMRTDPNLFDICKKYHGGNQESVDANPTHTRKYKDRTRIMEWLSRVMDGTCDEAEVALNLSHQSASARFSELKREGKIEKCGVRPTRSGCMAAVYVIKPPSFKDLRPTMTNSEDDQLPF